MTLLVPPNYDPRLDRMARNKPTTIFLAGPIQGAADWQSEAYEHIARRWQADWSQLIICSPRRSDATCKLASAGGWNFDYAQQVDWESYHLRAAANNGAILFWLAKEHKHTCERAYAQTTRFELGEWLAKRQEAVVIGIEPGFTGERYIRHRFSHLNIHSDLETTCKAAIAACRGGYIEPAAV